MIRISKEQRKKERNAWRELQIIIKGYRALGFEYIVNRLLPAKICFGSTLSREVLPKTGPAVSPLMRRITGKLEADVPFRQCNINGKPINQYRQTYVFLSKVKRGEKISFKFGPSMRMEKYSKSEKCRVPFGRSSKERQIRFHTPGPAALNLCTKRNYFQRHTFGGPMIQIPATQMICSPFPYKTCDECSELPCGDFWIDWPTNIVYCRPCMIKKRVQIGLTSKNLNLKCRDLKNLDNFSRVRMCHFYHEHKGTTASVKLLDKKVLVRKFRRENYLSKFNM